MVEASVTWWFPEDDDQVGELELGSLSSGELVPLPGFEPVPLKRCWRCGTDLPRSWFHRCRAAADGLQGACKACNRRVAALQHDQERGSS